jgi:hypothetical protein
MSNKTFTTAPRPQPLALDAVTAFERRGAGQDTRVAHISPIAIARDAKADVAEEASEPTRRLSLDLPESLHRRFKMACVKHDLKMVREVMDYIERRTTELESD